MMSGSFMTNIMSLELYPSYIPITPILPYCLMDSTKGLKYMYPNIRSLYRHCNELFLNYVNYDFVCIGRIWLKRKIQDNCIFFVNIHSLDKIE